MNDEEWEEEDWDEEEDESESLILTFNEAGEATLRKPSDYVSVEQRTWDLLRGFTEEYSKEWQAYIDEHRTDHDE